MRDLVSLEARTIASIIPGGSTSARSLRSRSESRETRRRGIHKNSPRRNRPRRLPIRARLLEQVRDQDERPLSAILGHWSDRSCVPPSSSLSMRLHGTGGAAIGVIGLEDLGAGRTAAIDKLGDIAERAADFAEIGVEHAMGDP